MGSIKSLAAASAAAALLFAACAAEEQGTPGAESPGTSPGIEQPTPGEQPGGPGGPVQDTPGTAASPGLASPMLGASPDAGASPDTGASPDVDESPGVGASPGSEPTPAATGEPGEAVRAIAVVDVAGTLHVLQDGECQITTPDGAADGGFGQPADGSTLQLTFAEGAGGQSLDLSIALSRGFPVPEPAESPSPALSPSPDAGQSPAASPGESPGASPGQSPGASPGSTPPLISGEDILPFTVLPEQVQLTVQVPGVDATGQPRILAGSVAPNGVNGYILAVAETGELLTINFVCADPQADTGEPGASPGASPEVSPEASPALSPGSESPGLEPSPSP